MNNETIRQRRDGTTLTTIDPGTDRSPSFLPGADASSTAFAFVVRLRRSLSRDDDAIAAAWAARTVRRRSGSEAVQAYDDSGAWTTPMEEAYAAGFVAFLRGAAWGGPWPPEAAHWKTQLAATMASCPDGIEGREVAAALDDAIRALYVRLVVLASKHGALPFHAPELTPQRPYIDPADASAPATFRKQSRTVGPAVDGAREGTMARPAPAVGFSPLDEPRPFRFLVPILVIAAGLVFVGGCFVVLSFTVFRPKADAAEKAAKATMEQLQAREFARIYDGGSAVLRKERWPEFGARVKRPESLGKMVDVSLQGPARIDRIPGVGRTATVIYDGTHVFGRSSFICRYVDVGLMGEWKLAEFDVMANPEVPDPPFAATPEGADALAKRTLYLFQQSDYSAIQALVNGEVEDRLRTESFRNTLIGDGFITKIDRTAYDSEIVNDIAVQTATYTIETSRDQRSGTLKLFLIPDGSSWKLAGMQTNMSYRY